jgi:vault protein inter-alpha-trypsin-like protein/VWA domain-containing protein
MLAALARSLRVVAALAGLALVSRVAAAQDRIVGASEGGRLEALDAEGERVGPCPLAHTDVDVEVSGLFARVRVVQRYENPYAEKIEAVYTFPLSHRAAVDRMRMTIGDRVVDGVVRERVAARAIYEAARDEGRVAGLLEQERPNVFTQSVANVEPGVAIDVEISYVEILQPKDGLFSFEFPTVVGPRYVPGAPSKAPLPDGLAARRGVVLLGPATLRLGEVGAAQRPRLDAGKLDVLLASARAIRRPSEERNYRVLWQRFEAEYADGLVEPGELWADGVGQIGGRWFVVDPDRASTCGSGFAGDTALVPDASRITPRPTRPGVRAGHDLAIRATIDTGGPAILDLRSLQHEILRTDVSPQSASVALVNAREIPNRDFVLQWRQAGDGIGEAVLTHADERGTFVSVLLEPPARVEAEQAVPRELVFVLDTSGSMSGRPIAKAKEVISKAIDRLRSRDTFDLVTFSGDTRVLWSEPRPATPENVIFAREFLESRRGGGGTEMMTAIETALAQRKPSGAAHPIRIVCFLTDGFVGNDLEILDAVKRYADTTRVFSFGIGSAVNRFLIDGMATAGRGASEIVLPSDDADAAVDRFARRIETPVLTDVQVEWSPSLGVTDAAGGSVPDLFDVTPIALHARAASPGLGTVVVSGTSGAGPWRREIPLDLRRGESKNAAIATLWARARVDAILGKDLDALQRGAVAADAKARVVELGETFGILTPFTSFVAVERERITIGGVPRLVNVPVELPEGVEGDKVAGSRVTARFGSDGRAGGTGPIPRRTPNDPTVPGTYGHSGGAGGGRAKKAALTSGSTDFLLGRGEHEPAPPREQLEDKLAKDVAELLAHGGLEDARQLVAAHLRAHPGSRIGIALSEALVGDASIRDAKVAAAVAAAGEARRAFEERRTLERRLDRRLLVRVEAPHAATESAAVSVLVASTDDAALGELRTAGLEIDAVLGARSVVAGRCPLDALMRLASLSSVKRIEPIDG